jgi:glycosyltransferase involved in cell wall biosynthesis
VPQPGPLPVALFVSSFIPGGTERQMIELSRRLDRRRFQVHLACFRRGGPWLSRAEQNAASVEEFPIRSFRDVATIAQMRAFARWCRRTGIAVVHATDLYANVFALPAAVAAGVPVRIGNRREINPDKSAGLIALQRAAYACATRVAANSQAAAARLRRERVPPRKVAVIPNGLDVEVFGVRQLPDRLRRVITVANLRTEKAHEVLLDAAALVLARYPDAEFWIVGGGARYDELTTLARQLGIESRTRFFGHRDDVPALLGESDIFVLPSRSEACPSGLIEAMASGLPVVATAVGGNVELVRHGETGLLVPPDDAGAIASAIHGLIESPDRAAVLGRAARDSVVCRFSFDRMVAAFERLYLTETSRAVRSAGLQACHQGAQAALKGCTTPQPEFRPD